MSEVSEFAARMRERFPEGLTGVFAAGGSRTTYLLGQQADQEQPGVINDFDAYAKYGLDRLFEQTAMYYELGGQNLISVIFSYRSLYERGDSYAEKAARMCLDIIDNSRLDFYRDLNIDPYIAGIDTFLALPDDHYAHQIGVEFEQFQQNWSYQEGRRKLIWEVAPIPLFSIWRAHEVMGADAEAELEAALAQCTDLRAMHDLLYSYYAQRCLWNRFACAALLSWYESQWRYEAAGVAADCTFGWRSVPDVLHTLSVAKYDPRSLRNDA